MYTQREISIVYGREDAPVENLYFNDIYALTSEMPEKEADIFDVKGCKDIIIENLKKYKIKGGSRVGSRLCLSIYSMIC